MTREKDGYSYMKISELSALETGRMIKEKKITVREALDACFANIDSQEPTIHAFVSYDKEAAYRRAEIVQREIDKNRYSSPLAGVPMGMKDNICTRGVPTTCSSRMLEHFIPSYNATVVEKLEAAGAVMIGKTNMDEFAMGSSTETSYFGITRNPWQTEHVPGGSSGGACAAVAARECFYGLGSDTGGSIRQPASHCGVVGMKPGYGTVSRRGLIAYASSLDQIGPVGKTVADCAAVLDVIAGYDAGDSTSERRDGGDYLSAVERGARGLRVGLPVNYLSDDMQPEVREAVMEALRALSDAGANVEEFELPYVEYAVPTYYVIASAEASSNLSRFDGVKFGYRSSESVGIDGSLHGNIHDLMKNTRSEGFGAEVKKRIMLGSFVLSSGFYDAYYLKALKTRTLIKTAFDQAFLRYDLLLGPVAPTTAPRIGVGLSDPMKMYLEDIYTVSANLAGLPGISVPWGKDQKGLPIGVQLMADRAGEELLFSAGRMLEKGRS